MSNYRIFVEKKSEFNVESRSLLNDLKENLQIKSLEKIRLLNTYDVLNIAPTDLEQAKKTIFAEPVTDIVSESFNLKGLKYFAVEYLPGQFDQRADSAMQCLGLISDNNDSIVKSGELIIMEGDLNAEDIAKIKNYYINPIESREKNLDIPPYNETVDTPKEVPVYEGFIYFQEQDLIDFQNDHGLAMTLDDLKFIQNYFKNEEKRNPKETEIKVLDTYWSDHCRHTTFESEIKNITIDNYF